MIELLIGLILLGTFLSMFLFVWFNTDAFIEYTRLFNIDHWFLVDEYTEATKDNPSTTYPEYLATHHSNFLIRMISCPKCFCIQLSALVHIPIALVLFIMGDWLMLPLIPVSIIIGAYFGLFFYYILVFIMNKAYH